MRSGKPVNLLLTHHPVAAVLCGNGSVRVRIRTVIAVFKPPTRPLSAFAQQKSTDFPGLTAPSDRAVRLWEMRAYPCPSSGPGWRWRIGGHAVMGITGQRLGSVRR